MRITECHRRAVIIANKIISVQNLIPFRCRHKLPTFVYEIQDQEFRSDQFEKFLIGQALHKTKVNKTHAAELHRINRRLLYSMMKSYHI